MDGWAQPFRFLLGLKSAELGPEATPGEAFNPLGWERTRVGAQPGRGDSPFTEEALEGFLGVTNLF